MAARPHERMAHHQARHVGGALPRAAGAAPQGDMNSALRSDVRPRELWGWAMYDFANSGYTTVVLTALFNAYFVTVVAGNAPWATLAWTAALSVSYALIVASAPIIGAFADRHAAKKRLLVITTLGCVLFTGLLYFAQTGTLWFALACVIMSNFFFGTGENLIAAFLPEIARVRSLGRVSGWGWSLGYIGGLTALGLCLMYVTWAQAQGQIAAQFVPVTMLMTAGLFALSSLPTFLLLRERALPRPTQEIRSGNAWRAVRQSLHLLRLLPDLRRFLVYTLFYQAGIQAVIILTAVYAHQAMGFTLRQTLIDYRGQHHGSRGRLSVRLFAGPYRPCARDCADVGGLDHDHPAGLGSARADIVLGRGKSCRSVSGRHAVCQPRPDGRADAAFMPGGILWVLGAGGETRLHRRTAHRQLFRDRPVPAPRCAGGAWSTRGAARRPA